MKYKLFLLCLFIFANCLLFAESPFSIGLNGGYTHSNVYFDFKNGFDSYNPNYNGYDDYSNISFGNNYGILFSYEINKNVNINTEINYVIFKNKKNYEYSIPDGSDGIFTSNTTVSYLNIPLLFNYKINYKSFNFSIKTGPWINILLNSEDKMLLKGHGPEFGRPFTIDTTLNLKDSINNIDYGLNISYKMGFEINKNFEIFINNAYYLGMRDIFKLQSDIKNNYYNINIGLMYKL